jgi:putative SOS response-associated peptidase YedK
VILKRDNIAEWIEPNTGQRELLAMLGPYPDGLIEAYPVSSKVNNPRNNEPECVARASLG